MTILLQIIYYLLGIPCLLLAAFFFLAGLFDPQHKTKPRMRISLLLAASLAGCLLYIAVQKGYVQHLYGAGIMYIVLAAVTFIITMFIGIFTGKVHWQ